MSHSLVHMIARKNRFYDYERGFARDHRQDLWIVKNSVGHRETYWWNDAINSVNGNCKF